MQLNNIITIFKFFNIAQVSWWSSSCIYVKSNLVIMVAVVVVVMVCASMCGMSGGGKEIQDVYMLHYLVLSFLFAYFIFLHVCKLGISWR